MIGNIEITQFSISILARNNNPTILNPDFLKINQIVPYDWETSSPIFTTEEFSRVTYKNNIAIATTPDRLILNQVIISDDFQLIIPEIAIKYLEILPHVDYYALVINFMSHVTNQNSEEIDNYLREFFLCPGEWKRFKNTLPKASCSLLYSLEDCEIELSIRPAYLESEESDNKDQAIIVFSGDVNRNFDDLQDINEQREHIKKYLKSCEQDLENYKNIINQYLNRG